MKLSVQRHVLLWVLVLALPLYGCAPPPVTGLPGPEAFQEQRLLTQQMDVHWRDRSVSLLGIVQIENSALEFFVTTLLGQEIFHLRYDGVSTTLVSHSDELPRRLRTEYLLRDLLWAQWPAASLQPRLTNAGFVLNDNGPTREIRAGADAGGKVILIAQRSAAGGLRIENPRFGYVLELSPVDGGDAP